MSNKDEKAMQTEKILKLGETKIGDYDRIRADILSRQERVAVFGDPIYVNYIGSIYTYDFNGFPVSIPFDGEYHSYPKDIAEDLKARLRKISINHLEKKVSGDGSKIAF